MGGISNDNILKFVLGISGLGLSLASFTLSRVFSLEDYTHQISEKVGANQIKTEYSQNSIKQLEDAERTRAERLSILETKLLIDEENIRQLKSEKSVKGN